MKRKSTIKKNRLINSNERQSSGSYLNFSLVPLSGKVKLPVLLFSGVMIWFFLHSFSSKKNQDWPGINEGVPLEETEEIKPAYQFLFDDLLCDGFVYPVKMNLSNYVSVQKGKTFSWKLDPDTALINHNTELFHTTHISAKNFPVVAPAKGIVSSVEKDTVNGCFVLYTKHCFTENAKLCRLKFEIRGIDSVTVMEDDTIKKGQVIGRLGKWKYKKGMAFAIKTSRVFVSPVPYHISGAICICKNYASVSLPENEKDLLVAVKHNYKMYHFKKGKLFNEYEIALSQDPKGHKQKQGDNKTAEGEYYISEKKKGPFYGDTGPWLGNSWMQFSYPNRFDAWEGYKRGAITLNECNSIVNSDKNKQPTLSYTDLGGRVGLHGWNGDWTADGTQNLTWGCISMHNDDVDKLYEIIPIGTRLIILP